MKTNSLIIFLVAALTFIGGSIGYFKASSLPSLIAALFYGISLSWTGVKVRKGSYKALGMALLLLASLVAFFSFRFYHSHKWMPAGVMVIVSGLSFATLVWRLIKTKL